jgi:hypothetical protein
MLAMANLLDISYDAYRESKVGANIFEVAFKFLLHAGLELPIVFLMFQAANRVRVDWHYGRSCVPTLRRADATKSEKASFNAELETSWIVKGMVSHFFFLLQV